MNVIVIRESGHDEALFGLGLSWGLSSGHTHWKRLDVVEQDKLETRACDLAHMDKGHNKFLRAISVHLDITAPMYWWSQFDTYKVGTVAQSESKMHTIMRRPLAQEHFEDGIPRLLLLYLEHLRREGHFHKLVQLLPMSFLQRRIVSTNYAVLRNILEQRNNHTLPEWEVFCDALEDQLEYPEYITHRLPLHQE
jgi:hypothetical protein